MPILLDRHDLLVALVPNAGSKFVERVLVGELGGQVVGERHDTIRRYQRRSGADLPAIRAIVVRDPLLWYRSHWCAAMARTRKPSAWPSWGSDGDGHPTVRLDQACGDARFERFVAKALAEFPNGFVRSMYCNFLNGATHVLRASHLRLDLEYLLRLAGVDGADVVRRPKPVNVSPAEWKAKATLPAASEARLRAIDHFDGLRLPDLYR